VVGYSDVVGDDDDDDDAGDFDGDCDNEHFRSWTFCLQIAIIVLHLVSHDLTHAVDLHKTASR